MSESVETDPSSLKPGHFIRKAEAVPSEPIVVAVSLTGQRACVYRNGIGIGVTTVSTGKPGYGTPTGIFTVLQKDKGHHSKNYNNAPLPYTERLTWDGTATERRPTAGTTRRKALRFFLPPCPASGKSPRTYSHCNVAGR